MTIVLSIAAPDMILMAADSAVTLDFGDSRGYEQGRKSYCFPGTGCVTTWGARDGNQIGRFLDQELAKFDHPSVKVLESLTYEYLTKEYRPNEIELDDVGYHVSGFDNNAVPRLSHVFWGFDRPRNPNQLIREYKKQNHSPGIGEWCFLYNGRNDIAETVINLLLREVACGGDIKFKISDPIDRVLFADFILRFSSEITLQVGPPFFYYVISKTNDVTILRNNDLTSINRSYVLEEFKKV